MSKLEGMTKFKTTCDQSLFIRASSLIRYLPATPKIGAATEGGSFVCHAEAWRRRVIRHF
jgi:hypothetical protein